jgi:hypothetical protein
VASCLDDKLISFLVAAIITSKMCNRPLSFKYFHPLCIFEEHQYCYGFGLSFIFPLQILCFPPTASHLALRAEGKMIRRSWPLTSFRSDERVSNRKPLRWSSSRWFQIRFRDPNSLDRPSRGSTAGHLSMPTHEGCPSWYSRRSGCIRSRLQTDKLTGEHSVLLGFYDVLWTKARS